MLSDKRETLPLSRLARLSMRRRRKATVHLWIERKEFRCPRCGSHDVSACEVRERLMRGVPNGNVPVLIHFHAHRIYCRECGKMAGEQFAFLPTPKSRIT